MQGYVINWEKKNKKSWDTNLRDAEVYRFRDNENKYLIPQADVSGVASYIIFLFFVDSNIRQLFHKVQAGGLIKFIPIKWCWYSGMELMNFPFCTSSFYYVK